MNWLVRIFPNKPKDLSVEESRRDLGRRISKLILPIVFISWLTFLSITSPVFLTWRNLSNVSRQVAVVGLLSVGQLLVMLTGNIDLSSASFMGLFGAVLADQSKEMPFPVAIGMALILALVWGLTNGYLVTRGRNISVIVTLSTMYIAQGLLLIYTQGQPVILFPMPYEFLGIGALGPIPWSLIAFMIVALIIAVGLRFTPVGRHIYATGGNRDAARVCGIDVSRLIIGVYTASAMIAALASLILLSRVASAQPNAGVGMELDSIAAVLIGGASVSGGYGTVLGTLVGVFLLGFINNGLNLLGVSGYYQYVFKGVIILMAVLVETLQRRGD